MVDVLLIQETKLDDSFPNKQFEVPDYMLYRADYKSNSGGLMTHIRSDLPQRRRFDLEKCDTNEGRIELLVVEYTYRKEKWIICNMYKQPQTPDAILLTIMDKLMCNLSSENVNFIVAGDLNINMLNVTNCLTLLVRYGSFWTRTRLWSSTISKPFDRFTSNFKYSWTMPR